MLSIIIPAKNEEKNIEKLLISLKRQSFKDFEIIVADADSHDKTASIAKCFGARIVRGGMPGVGRNKGAEISRGKDLLFIDADVVLPKDFLEKNYGEFVKRALDISTTFMNPISKKLVDKFIHDQINMWYVLIEKIAPAACGFHIFVKKEWFDKINGFNEQIIFGEDHDFVQRIWKLGGRFGILRGQKINVSVRRLDKEGRFFFLLKGLYGFLYYKIKGPMYYGSISYEFDAYKTPLKVN